MHFVPEQCISSPAREIVQGYLIDYDYDYDYDYDEDLLVSAPDGRAEGSR